MDPVHFSSSSDEWATPQDVYESLCNWAEISPTLDVCATRENTKCPSFFALETGQNGLVCDWNNQTAWLNPPYSREEKACEKDCKKRRCVRRKWHLTVDKPSILPWVAKASAHLAPVLCLLPARTDAWWWHWYVQPIIDRERPGKVKFFRGRIRFVGGKSGAPFPSVGVLFLPKETR